MKPKQINVVQEGPTEVVDLDHVAVHLNTVLAQSPDVDLLHRCLVYFAGYRAVQPLGTQPTLILPARNGAR